VEQKEVIRSLAALAHPIRLQVFRALVVAGKNGMTPGTMAEGLAIPADTLSFHLKELGHAGLVSLQASLAFYSKMFAAEPARLEADYAKWMLEDPRINFAISTRASKPGRSSRHPDRYRRGARRAEGTRPGRGPGSARRRRGQLLLRPQRKALGHRSPRHRLGAFPDAGRHPGIQRESRGGGQLAGGRVLRCAGVFSCCDRYSAEANVLLLRARVADKTYNVLFICTGNSARSILAEALLSHAGKGCFKAYSAGSHPTGTVNPGALEALRAMGAPATGARSKNWDEFAAPGAPAMDFIVTVCDSAAGEACPVWPGHPMTAHWGMPDPAAVKGTEDETRAAFRDAVVTLKRRIDLMLALPLSTLDSMATRRELRDIGERRA
jgi:arsenate reductase (thioredoxin)